METFETFSCETETTTMMMAEGGNEKKRTERALDNSTQHSC